MAKLTISPGYWMLLACVLYLGDFPWLILWLGGVFLHEAGHLFTLFLLHIPVLSLRFSLAGARIETGPMSYPEEFFVALSGPVVGLIPLAFWHICPNFSTFSGLLSVINLLPLYPLDGGRCLHCALALWTTPTKSHLVMRTMEWITGSLLTLWCLYKTFFLSVGLWPLFLLFFLGLRMLCAKRFP